MDIFIWGIKSHDHTEDGAGLRTIRVYDKSGQHVIDRQIVVPDERYGSAKNAYRRFAVSPGGDVYVALGLESNYFYSDGIEIGETLSFGVYKCGMDGAPIGIGDASAPGGVKWLADLRSPGDPALVFNHDWVISAEAIGVPPDVVTTITMTSNFCWDGDPCLSICLNVVYFSDTWVTRRVVRTVRAQTVSTASLIVAASAPVRASGAVLTSSGLRGLCLSYGGIH